MLRRTMLVGLASLTLVGGCSSSGGSASRGVGVGKRDLATTLAADPAFSSLEEWITAAEYAPTLRSGGPLTLFAPNDDAIGGVRQGLRSRLLKPENRDLLRAVLDRHVVPGYFPLEQIKLTRVLRTLDGGEVKITHAGQSLRFGTGNLVRTNIGAGNGLIHAIDQVQFPPGLFY
ncbi:MAG TPA: fasciclin domain-containing protein [Dongiaceae bacterium]